MIRIALTVVLAGLVGCGTNKEDQGGANPGTEKNANGGAENNSAGGGETKPTADPEKKTAAAGGWKDGDTIPSGTAGVPDIKILKVHKNGSGDACGTGKKATLAYKAMLANGTVLDPGTRPYSFAVGTGNAIKGWHVVVSKMKVGDSFTIMLPQQLAYGPSKGDLKFDMELLSVE